MSDFKFHTADPEESQNEDLMPMLSGESHRHPSDGNELLSGSFRKKQSQSSRGGFVHRIKRESTVEGTEEDREYQNTKMVQLCTRRLSDRGQYTANIDINDCTMDVTNSVIPSDTLYSNAQE